MIQNLQSDAERAEIFRPLSTLRSTSSASILVDKGVVRHLALASGDFGIVARCKGVQHFVHLAFLHPVRLRVRPELGPVLLQINFLALHTRNAAGLQAATNDMGVWVCASLET